MRLAMLLFVILVSFAGCAMPQLRVTVTAEGEWKNPLTGEKKQATIKPLVLLQPADGSEEPKRVQSFGGLDWQLWVAISPVTLTIQIRANQTLSGVEITFNEREQKFLPAYHPLTMTTKAQGNLANNEITVTVFVRESGRTIPKWKLLVRPERHGRPVRFLFEAVAPSRNGNFSFALNGMGDRCDFCLKHPPSLTKMCKLLFPSRGSDGKQEASFRKFRLNI